jgi:hypothetical protein
VGERALCLAVADVLEHRVREPEVERPVRERQRPAVGLHGRDLGERLGEARERRHADRGDPRGPRIPGLEEVVGTIPERRVGHADVQDRGLGPRTERLQKEVELPPAAPQRDAVGEAAQHGGSLTGRGPA